MLTDLDVSALVGAHRRLGAEATIHLIAVDDPSSFGVVDIGEMTDGAGLVNAFVEKPAPGTEPSNLISAGTYVLEPSVLELMQPGVRASIERDVFPTVVERGGLYGVATDDYWIDAGRPELYRAANLDLSSGVRVHDRCEPIDGAALVTSSAIVRNSIVGAGAEIGAERIGDRFGDPAGRTCRPRGARRVVARDGRRRFERQGVERYGRCPRPRGRWGRATRRGGSGLSARVTGST